MDYWPEVLQVLPAQKYKVYIYFDDGTIRLYDASQIIKKGVFQPLQDEQKFAEACTVINGTLAWTLDLSYSDETCLDLDPFVLYENCPIVDDPLL